MPMYDYKCPKCKSKFGALRRVSERETAPCPNCGQKADKQILIPTAVHYKGSGWFCKDRGY